MDHRLRKCTFFLVRKKKKAGGKEPSRLCGTCFAVGMRLDGASDEAAQEADLAYAVTARHVIENTPSSEELYIRVNTLDGSPPMMFPLRSPRGEFIRPPMLRCAQSIGRGSNSGHYGASDFEVAQG